MARIFLDPEFAQENKGIFPNQKFLKNFLRGPKRKNDFLQLSSFEKIKNGKFLERSNI